MTEWSREHVGSEVAEVARLDLDGSDFYGAHLRGSIVGACPKGVTAWTHSTHSLPVLASEREARVRVGCKINGRQTALGGYF